MAKRADIEYGSVYGLLTILGEGTPHIYPSGKPRRKVICQCACGSEPKEIMYNNILSGTATSCGCISLARVTTHGMFKTRQYQCWADMKKRCDNCNIEAYESYGLRGISYQESWKTFEGFWADMQEGYSDDLTLDRIDVDGNYTKENCRWSSQSVQSHNKRKVESSRNYIGVSKGKGDPKYCAMLTKDGECIYLGKYVNEEDAAKAYDDGSYEIFLDRPNKTVQNNDWVYKKVIGHINSQMEKV